MSADATDNTDEPENPESPDAGLPKYKESAQTCIKGEAFFASLIAQHAIPHHVTGQKDIGLDYICEWTDGVDPTGLLFGVQIKTFTVSKRSKVLAEKRKSTLNWLEEYRLTDPHLKIEPATMNYWRGLGIPFFLFAVARTKEVDGKEESLDLFYRRFTVVLTLNQPQEQDPFYKVNRGTRFIAFADDEKKKKGFARDLYIDLMRWQYFKGSIAYIKPSRLGLKEFREQDSVFDDLFKDYREQVCTTYAKTKAYLDQKCTGSMAPGKDG
jgi:Domain of unknown function (DUF4365)